MQPLTPYPITPIGNFIGLVLALLPLLSNIRKLSLAVWGYSIWIAIYNFITFVDTIVWHNNVNIVAPVWCDIAIKFQQGATFGTRACTFMICIHLYKITRLRGPLQAVNTKNQKIRAMVYELLVIIGLPFLLMTLLIVVQPVRFEIIEELGCAFAIYSYVAYITVYGPALFSNIGCAILAPLSIGTFLRHRKEMNEFLSTARDMSHNKYYRLMVIACLDTIFNLPVLFVVIGTEIARGKDSSLNYPYISWKNVHDGAGGTAPGTSLSTILQTPADEWSADRWVLFTVKWSEWLYVLHAIMFFSVFGTTPEMRSYYRAAFLFVPERLGFKSQKNVSEVETVSDIAFNSIPNQRAPVRPAAKRHRGSMSIVDNTETTIIPTSATHSVEALDTLA